MFSKTICNISGSYQSCGNTYSVTESKTFKLEPLLSENTRPWDVQNFPTITWTALPNKLYTLFIFDAGAYINHGVFININQNDIQNSEVYLNNFFIIYVCVFFIYIINYNCEKKENVNSNMNINIRNTYFQ